VFFLKVFFQSFFAAVVSAPLIIIASIIAVAMYVIIFVCVKFCFPFMRFSKMAIAMNTINIVQNFSMSANIQNGLRDFVCNPKSIARCFVGGFFSRFCFLDRNRASPSFAVFDPFRFLDVNVWRWWVIGRLPYTGCPPSLRVPHGVCQAISRRGA